MDEEEGVVPVNDKELADKIADALRGTDEKRIL